MHLWQLFQAVLLFLRWLSEQDFLFKAFLLLTQIFEKKVADIKRFSKICGYQRLQSGKISGKKVIPSLPELPNPAFKKAGLFRHRGQGIFLQFPLHWNQFYPKEDVRIHQRSVYPRAAIGNIPVKSIDLKFAFKNVSFPLDSKL